MSSAAMLSSSPTGASYFSCSESSAVEAMVGNFRSKVMELFEADHLVEWFEGEDIRKTKMSCSDLHDSIRNAIKRVNAPADRRRLIYFLTFVESFVSPFPCSELFSVPDNELENPYGPHNGPSCESFYANQLRYDHTGFIYTSLGDLMKKLDLTGIPIDQPSRQEALQEVVAISVDLYGRKRLMCQAQAEVEAALPRNEEESKKENAKLKKLEKKLQNAQAEVIDGYTEYIPKWIEKLGESTSVALATIFKQIKVRSDGYKIGWPAIPMLPLMLPHTTHDVEAFKAILGSFTEARGSKNETNIANQQISLERKRGPMSPIKRMK